MEYATPPKHLDPSRIVLPETVLSADQSRAVDLVMSALRAGQREVVLTGAAGTGKTTSLRSVFAQIDREGWTLFPMAPTGKAAARMSRVTGRRAMTTHSLLYTKVVENTEGEPIFLDPKDVTREREIPFGGGDDDQEYARRGGNRCVVVVDESSMLGSRVKDDMMAHMEANTCVLFVGDREQLAPVNDRWGPDFDNPTAELTEIHRQAAESPIIQLATAIREGKDWPDLGKTKRVRRVSTKIAGAANWLAEARSAGASATLLTYTNSTRVQLNREVRRLLGRTLPLEVGDTVVCTANCYGAGVMNGEVATVVGLGAYDEERPSTWIDVGLKIRPMTIPHLVGAEKKEWKDAIDEGYGSKRRTLQLDYGECLTVHRAQGSEWDHVGVVMDDMFLGMAGNGHAGHYKRLLYTAVTRAAKTLTLFRV